MRHGNEAGFLFDDNGQLIALNLGSDYCAEHEWGIKDLRRTFGMDDQSLGLDKRLAKQTSEDLVWVSASTKGSNNKTVKYEGLWLRSWSGATEPHDVFFYRESTLWTGWSERDFGAFSTNENEIAHLKELFDLFQKPNSVAIWLGGGGVFKNAGLVIGVAPRFSEELRTSWLKADEEALKLKADAEATGIHARLKAANMRYFACSAKRQKDGSIKFWLNPEEQHKTNCGLYSVEELDQWIAGKGPIPMTPEQQKKRR